jgi:hypothetical protein
MLTEPTTARTVDPAPPTSEARAHAREAEQAARRLIARAAHLEKRAGRLRIGATERMSLDAKARELRAEADLLLSEVAELARRMRPAPARAA